MVYHTDMSTQTTQLEKLVVQSVVERVLARHGHNTSHINDVKVTQNAEGKLLFDVILDIPMADLNIRLIGAQDRKPELVMCDDADL